MCHARPERTGAGAGGRGGVLVYLLCVQEHEDEAQRQRELDEGVEGAEVVAENGQGHKLHCNIAADRITLRYDDSTVDRE